MTDHSGDSHVPKPRDGDDVARDGSADSQGQGAAAGQESPFPTLSDDGSAQVAALGTQIGPYKLLSVLGEGGMAVVYLAEQERPVRRRVALKVVKAGLDTKQVIARFEAERQALAMMDHPNIAKVLGAGATDAGRPYFLMEWVRGEAITKYCDRQKLTIEQRLDLFIQVCRAVQHAHQKGLIHRDLKPSNVLVAAGDEGPLPKVIDFGVAKATAQRLTERTLFTEQGKLIGTPAYMSPEQAEMTATDVDTRSDVYSLGVVLYELLTGALPFGPAELRKAGFAEIQRIIREVEPLRPSTKLTSMAVDSETSARNRQTELRTLYRRLRRELDWITMKALEKDRTRRYATADALAADVRRYLNNDPPEAGPPSAAYRIRKLAGKYRRQLTAAAAMLVVLLAVAVLAYVRIARERANALGAAGREEAQRIRADKEADKARREAGRALRSLYFNRIALADVEYRQANIRRVRELLELCPGQFRDWEWYRLRHVQDQSVRTRRFREGISGGHSIAFSRDGKWAAVGLADGTAALFEPHRPNESRILKGHEADIYAIAFGPDGKLVVTGSKDRTIRLWRSTTGMHVRTLEGHGGAVCSVAFSPDGKRLCSASEDGALKLWTIAGEARATTLRGHADDVNSVCFSPDGQWIVSGSADGTLKVWDVDTAQVRADFAGHRAAINNVALDQGGRRVLSSGADEIIKVWDVKTTAETAILRGHVGAIASADFASNGRQIVSAGRDTRVIIWDALTGRRTRVLCGHTSPICAMAVSPDGKWALSAALDGTVKLWDLEHNMDLRALIGHTGFVLSTAWIGNDRHIVSGGADGTVRIWDVEAGRDKQLFGSPNAPVFCVASSSDGSRIASAGQDRTVRVWDAATGALLSRLRGHDGMVLSVAFSPDGRQIVSAGEDRSIALWSAEAGTRLMTMQHPKGVVWSVAFAPDGRRVVSAGEDQTLRVWDTATGAGVAAFPGHAGTVFSAACSPDGRTIASGSEDRTVRLWDAARGACTMVLRGHTGPVYSVAYSPNGKRIVSGSEDGTIRIWDTVSGSQVMSLRADAGAIWCVAFSRDGATIVSGTSDGKILIWPSARKGTEDSRQLVQPNDSRTQKR